MENLQKQQVRRHFIKQASALALSFSALPAVAKLIKTNASADKTPPLPADMVFEFVGVSHGNIKRVKEMLEKVPTLINATWDWAAGDFETALGGASHMGRQDIANYLLEKGARKDIYCAAMLGEKKLVQSFIKTDPSIANVLGPHKYTLLYHVAISKNIDMAKIVKPHITDTAANFNQALHAAVRNNDTEMAEWLLKNGVNDPNTGDFARNRPLQNAQKNGFNEMGKLLKEHGAI